MPTTLHAHPIGQFPDVYQTLDRLKERASQLPEVATAASSGEFIKISQGKTVLTKCDNKMFKDCVPIRVLDYSFTNKTPSMNTSAGMGTGGTKNISLIGVVIDANAEVKSLGATMVGGKDLNLEYVTVQETAGKIQPKEGVEFKRCLLLNTPDKYGEFSLLVFSCQSFEFKKFSFDNQGKKQGVSDAGSFDTATGAAVAG